MAITVTDLEAQFLDLYKDTTEETRTEDFYQKCMKLFNSGTQAGEQKGLKKYRDYRKELLDELDRSIMSDDTFYDTLVKLTKKI